MENKPLYLKNEIQDYAWGSYEFIQDLLGAEQTDTPWAELWMGAHPKAPSKIQVNGEWRALDRLIESYPEEILGRETARRFNNTLPYLFKVLAAEHPLSIQAHPNREQAKNGFDRENHEGIPLTASNRNYKDDRHKPECICALTPFWAMEGFRPISEMVELLKAACPKTLGDAIAYLKQKPDGNGFHRFFEALMTLPKPKLQQVIDETARNAIVRQAENDEFRWIKTLYELYPEDIGILSPILLNLVCLQPGEALFLNSGEMHAYLHGAGIEIMANSDNVLRGGLTAKHVDVEELMRVLNFDPHGLQILNPQERPACEKVYPTPAEEFSLGVIQVDAHCSYSTEQIIGPEILLCTHGDGEIQWDDAAETLRISKGDAFLIPAAVKRYSISGTAQIYRAAVGDLLPA
ncbi:MAG: mannose-6-phosphate isomerase, class I [Desulfobacterales bacterium]|nr:mannose-6-phosphate isomerase, class I [Desulfobacterales bacterium]